jgi:hypothetical protein
VTASRLAGAIILAVSASALALTAACLPETDDDEPDTGSNPGVVVVVQTPSPEESEEVRESTPPTPTPSPTPLQVCGTNPDPAPPSILVVEVPGVAQNVKIPFSVRGWGSNIGFENQGVALAIVDGTQTVRQVLELPPQPREYRIAPAGLQITEFTKPFAADIVIQGLTGPTPFCLWVYQQTNEEGQPRGVVQVPIIVSP